MSTNSLLTKTRQNGHEHLVEILAHYLCLIVRVVLKRSGDEEVYGSAQEFCVGARLGLEP